MSQKGIFKPLRIRYCCKLCWHLDAFETTSPGASLQTWGGLSLGLGWEQAVLSEICSRTPSYHLSDLVLSYRLASEVVCPRKDFQKARIHRVLRVSWTQVLPQWHVLQSWSLHGWLFGKGPGSVSINSRNPQLVLPLCPLVLFLTGLCLPGRLSRA